MTHSAPKPDLIITDIHGYEHVVRGLDGMVEDNDGLRVITEEMIASVRAQLFRKFFDVEIPAPKYFLGLVRAQIKPTILKYINRVYGEAKAAHVNANYNLVADGFMDICLDNIVNTEKVVWTPDFLVFFQRRCQAGVDAVMATNACGRWYQAMMNRFKDEGIYELDKAHHTRENFPAKPDPTMVSAATQILGPNSVMIGDSIADAISGVNAGLVTAVRRCAIPQLEAAQFSHPSLHVIEDLSALRFA